jgi:hypothetical protein
MAVWRVILGGSSLAIFIVIFHMEIGILGVFFLDKAQ